MTVQTEISFKFDYYHPQLESGHIWSVGSQWKLSGRLGCDLGRLDLTVSRQAYRKVIKQASMQVSELVGKLVEVTKFTDYLCSVILDM